jgi:type IV pilus assembly protein PilO
MAGPQTQAPQNRFQKLGGGVKLLIAIGGMAVLAAAYYLFFYSDLAKAIEAADARHAQLENDERAAQLAYRAYLDDSTKLEEKRARSRELNKVLPESTEIAGFLSSVNQQAEISGLKINKITPANEEVQQYYARVPVDLEVVGRFHQIAKFFAGVGRLERVINIENIQLNVSGKSEDDETMLRVNCRATTFHANAKPAGAPGGPK